MKHTKEKWRVAEFMRENAPNIVSVMSGTDTIVDLPETNNKREYAKLISKAPEMYEALKKVISIVNDSTGVNGYHTNGNDAEWDEFEEIIEIEALIKEIES